MKRIQCETENQSIVQEYMFACFGEQAELEIHLHDENSLKLSDAFGNSDIFYCDNDGIVRVDF